MLENNQSIGGPAICGHDREALRWALYFSDLGDCAGICNPATVRDIFDPAKLAAITVELLQRRGIPSDTDFPATSLIEDPSTWVCRPNEDTTETTIDIVRGDDILTVTMPAARRFALALLDAPADANAEQMIAEVAK